MGSILRKEKLGQIAHSGGNITLGPSTFNIGARQFVTTTTLSVPVGSPGVNALRYVYLVNNAGTPELVVSQNVNSVGPTSYNNWKLIAAFYADGVSGAFGSFVNIKGEPSSGWIDYTPTSQGFGTPTFNYARYRRGGTKIQIQVGFDSGSVTAVLGKIGIPGVNAVVPYNNTMVGYWLQTNAAASNFGLAVLLSSTDTTSMFFGNTPHNGNPTGSLILSNANIVSTSAPVSWNADFEVQEWSDIRSLEDL
jgi:hypothetical protein